MIQNIKQAGSPKLYSSPHIDMNMYHNEKVYIQLYDIQYNYHSLVEIENNPIILFACVRVANCND